MKRIAVIVAAMFGLILFGPALGNFSKFLAEWDFGGPSSSAEVAVTAAPPINGAISAKCPGEIELVTLGDEPVVINPGGRCVVKWRVDEGRVDLIDTAGNIVNVGSEAVSLDTFWIEAVRASTEGAKMHYKLVTG